jgi:hypothetical protein
MAWSASKIFTATITDLMNNTTAIDLNTDASIKAALYDNDITPDQTVASASTAYGAGQWVSAGNEVSDAAEWPVTGQALGTITSGFATNVYTFDAADEVSDGTSATLAAVFGCLVYDDTITTPVIDQGLCYNYFGGTNSVTDGTFTIVWHSSGIFALTL